jgi:hypothetical protein
VEFKVFTVHEGCTAHRCYGFVTCDLLSIVFHMYLHLEIHKIQICLQAQVMSFTKENAVDLLCVGSVS